MIAPALSLTSGRLTVFPMIGIPRGYTSLTGRSSVTLRRSNVGPVRAGSRVENTPIAADRPTADRADDVTFINLED